MVKRWRDVIVFLGGIVSAWSAIATAEKSGVRHGVILATNTPFVVRD